MSLPSTMSSFAITSSPACTESTPACAANIFWLIVIPDISNLLFLFRTLVGMPARKHVLFE